MGVVCDSSQHDCERTPHPEVGVMESHCTTMITPLHCEDLYSLIDRSVYDHPRIRECCPLGVASLPDEQTIRTRIPTLDTRQSAHLSYRSGAFIGAQDPYQAYTVRVGVPTSTWLHCERLLSLSQECMVMPNHCVLLCTGVYTRTSCAHHIL